MKINQVNVNTKKTIIKYHNDGRESNSCGGQQGHQFSKSKFLWLDSTFYVLEFGSWCEFWWKEGSVKK